MNRGFTNPEIHEVKRIVAHKTEFEEGSCLRIHFDQGGCDAGGGVIPSIGAFGSPDMADKFARLAASINEIFGESSAVPIYDRPPTITAHKPPDERLDETLGSFLHLSGH